MSMISAGIARLTLDAQLDRVEAGEEVAITREGRVVAVLVHPDAVPGQRTASGWAAADRLGEMLETARRVAVVPRGLTAERADVLVQAVRAWRAA